MKTKIMLGMFLSIVLLYSTILPSTIRQNQKPVLQNTWSQQPTCSIDTNGTANPFCYRKPTDRWGKWKNHTPKPTNRWFVNSTFTTLAGQQLCPLNSFPFVTNITDSSLQICCPLAPTALVPPPVGVYYNSTGVYTQKVPTNENYSPPFYQTTFINTLEFYALELDPKNMSQDQHAKIVSNIYNQPFSVTYEWGTDEKGFIAPIVRGMPYVTILTEQITPAFKTIQAITAVNNKKLNNPGLSADPIDPITKKALSTIFTIPQNNKLTNFTLNTPNTTAAEKTALEKQQQAFANQIQIQIAAAIKNNSPLILTCQLIKNKGLELYAGYATQSNNTPIATIFANVTEPCSISYTLEQPNNQLSTQQTFPLQFNTEYLIFAATPSFPKPGISTTSISSNHFIIDLNNNQTWHIFSSEPMTLDFSINWPDQNKGTTYSIQSKNAFSGVIRLTEQSIFPTDTNNALKLTYLNTYPLAGTMNFTTSGNQSNIQFNWQTKQSFAWNKQGSNQLLMMCLPHHYNNKFLQNEFNNNVTFTSARGQMYGVIGNPWKISVPLPSIAWQAPSSKNISTKHKASIINALKNDVANLTNPGFAPTATDPYNFGKEIAKLARLALIAQEFNQTTELGKILASMSEYLTPWVTGTPLNIIGTKPQKKNYLTYDSIWGGICSQQGLESYYNDFGQGWYNDHHFHYGYYIYAAAAFINLANNMPEYKRFISQLLPFTLDLVRDIASPIADNYFPDYRIFDWYLGHSLAAGLFPFGTGKNQESTSEAINAWYGIYLLGKATNNSSLQSLGNTLLACEVHSAQTYWFLVPNISTYQGLPNYGVYPPTVLYNKNQVNPCVGILWEMKADFQTFFNDQLPSPQDGMRIDNTPIEYLNLIHFLPFTPVTEIAIPKLWNDFQYGLAPSSDYQIPLSQAPFLPKNYTVNAAQNRTLLNAIANPANNLNNSPLIKQFRQQASAIWQGWLGFIYMSHAISDPVKAWTEATATTTSDPINKPVIANFDNGNSKTNMLYWIATRPNA